MAATFSTFCASEPDCDGDVCIESVVSIINETEHKIYQMQYRSLLVDKDGVGIFLDDYVEDMYLAPGDEASLHLRGGYFNLNRLSHPEIFSKTTLWLCRREFEILGELQVPSPGGSSRLIVPITSDSIDSPITVLLNRSTSDDEGDQKLESSCLLYNKTNQLLRTLIISQLFDREGVEIERDETVTKVQGESPMLITSSFWAAGMAGQLNDSKVIYSLKTLVQVERYDIKATTNISL